MSKFYTEKNETYKANFPIIVQKYFKQTYND